MFGGKIPSPNLRQVFGYKFIFWGRPTNVLVKKVSMLDTNLVLWMRN